MEEHAPGIGSQGASDAQERIAAEQYNKTDKLDYECRLCAPFSCDDPDNHLDIPAKYTPLKNLGCHCGADLDGRDCMCFEDQS